MNRYIRTFRKLTVAAGLVTCSTLANAGLLIDSINVQMTNTTFSARSAAERQENDNARAFDNARSAFNRSFSEQGFCDQALDALIDVTARQTCGGSKRNYGALFTITGTNTGVTNFEFGLDWGRGGFISFDGANGSDLIRRTDDVWWSRNWGNRDVIDYRLDQQGEFTLTMLGFEGCCDGINSVRYRNTPIGNGLPGESNTNNIVFPQPQDTSLEWQTLAINSSSEIPVPGSMALLALGSGLLFRRRLS